MTNAKRIAELREIEAAANTDLAHVREELEALGVVEPQWSATPPTEPGFYWLQYWRSGQYERGIAEVFECDWPSEKFLAFYSTCNPMNSWERIERELDEDDKPHLWFSVRIEEPR